VTPGVPAFAAAAATLKAELTLPGVSQSVVLTRLAERASPMPSGETLDAFARSGATLAIHLAVRQIDRIVAELTPRYGADCPVAVAARVGWPDELLLRGTLGDIAAKVRASGTLRTAVILVGRVLDPGGFADSRLYAADHRRAFKPGDES